MPNPYGLKKYRRNRIIVLERDGFKCKWPGCYARATTADHIIPLARGGTNDLANLRASCAYHNSAGGAELANASRRERQVGNRSRRW
jgi:5-methylcytosine-specific restriction endonuclease McrA